LKRSNRLVLLVGIFLAVLAFVGIAVILGQGGGGSGTNPNAPVTTTTRVIAKADIPLGAVITDEMVDTDGPVDLAKAAPNGYKDQALVIGQPARQAVKTGQEITSDVIVGGSAAGQCTEVKVPTGQRAISVQVDQVSGVGTLIKPGDFVDMVVGFTGDKFPVVQVQPQAGTGQAGITVVSGLNSTSVKLLLQGMQVLCALLPPPPADNGQTQGGTTTGGSTGLNGQQEIAIISVNSQQAEVVKFAQMDGNVSLILRNSGEFFDPNTNQPIPAIPEVTTGITLKVLVDGGYGVLPPEVIEAILPAQTTKP
jgi:pilus assembly protein CpaB